MQAHLLGRRMANLALLAPIAAALAASASLAASADNGAAKATHEEL